MKVNETIATRTYDNLLICPIGEHYKKVAELDESAKEAKKGSLLGFAEPGGKLFVVGAQTTVGEAEGAETQTMTLTPSSILAEDANGETVATVFEAGIFNSEMIITENEYELTDNDIDTLRKYNIRFEKPVY